MGSRHDPFGMCWPSGIADFRTPAGQKATVSGADVTKPSLLRRRAYR
jgi:hypothetical protein